MPLPLALRTLKVFTGGHRRGEAVVAGNVPELGVIWVFYPDNPRLFPVDPAHGAYPDYSAAVWVWDVALDADDGVVGTTPGAFGGGAYPLGRGGLRGRLIVR